ncbi:hypothetical protein C5167_036418 [Papaver somniferum]|uniref:Uncharacterized protein n=1 Tax=Papaver somniferum TaxID=3469 RepID=A0A4Y7I748_PAPSO|nr:hypothetical protein C5167_036418 [Papaver somniferum]
MHRHDDNNYSTQMIMKNCNQSFSKCQAPMMIKNCNQWCKNCNQWCSECQSSELIFTGQHYPVNNTFFDRPVRVLSRPWLVNSIQSTVNITLGLSTGLYESRRIKTVTKSLL